jgi:hypothetical protein
MCNQTSTNNTNEEPLTDNLMLISQERDHLESIIANRFNFFIAFLTAVITGAAAILFFNFDKNSKLGEIPPQNLIICLAILILGGVILLLIKATIKRGQVRLNILIDCIMTDEQHPNTQILNIIKKIQEGDTKYSEIVEEKKYLNSVKKTKSRRKYIGYCIPSYCLCVLAALIIVVSYMLICYYCSKS